MNVVVDVQSMLSSLSQILHQFYKFKNQISGLQTSIYTHAETNCTYFNLWIFSEVTRRSHTSTKAEQSETCQVLSVEIINEKENGPLT